MNSIRMMALAAGLLGVAGVASAQVSSTITATNDYDFRGFSQSAKDPAIQASLDYAFGESGWAIGAWASNVDFDNDADIELDLYASYTGAINDNLSWTAGGTYYAYPGSDDVGEYPEFFIGLNAGAFSFKQWYSNDFYNLDDKVSAQYSEVNGTFELPAGFSFLAHVGYSWGDYWDEVGGGELFDYSVGVGYSLENFALALKWVDTDANDDQKITGDVGNNEGRVIFTVSTTLPWGE